VRRSVIFAVGFRGFERRREKEDGRERIRWVMKRVDVDGDRVTWDGKGAGMEVDTVIFVD
jgi:hypothetical protein